MGNFSIPNQTGDRAEGPEQDLNILPFILLLSPRKKNIFCQECVTLIILYGRIGVDGSE